MSRLPLVLIPGILGETDESSLDLPRRADNLFERIIRNPLPPGSAPKERECAEMLCAVLLNAPDIRYALMKWLGDLSGYEGIPFDELDLHIETEQSVYGKRDDLRITGLPSDSEEEDFVLLWTIELKVGASFSHGSSVVDGDDNDVSQIQNYDSWLADQEAAHKAGFVLAKSDRSSGLPHHLANPWICISWARMAAQLRTILTNGNDLTSIDRFLGRHLLSFIRFHFGEERQSMDEQFDFDDISVLRAFAQVGVRAGHKVNKLVEGLIPVLERMDAGIGNVRMTKASIFGGHMRCILIQSLSPTGEGYPLLFAGIHLSPQPAFRLVIEMAPRYERRQDIYKSFERRLPILDDVGSNWDLTPWDDYSWHLLVSVVPLEHLLSQDDQQAWLSDYTCRELTALKESGLVDDIRRIAGQQTPSPV